MRFQVKGFTKPQGPIDPCAREGGTSGSFFLGKRTWEHMRLALPLTCFWLFWVLWQDT